MAIEFNELVVASWTVILGSLVALFGFVIKEFLVFFVFDVIRDFRKLRAKISETVSYYAYISPATPFSEQRTASKDLRVLATETNAFSRTINWFVRLFLTCSGEDLKEIADSLFWLSNSTYSDDFEEINRRRKRINTLLKLKIFVNEENNTD